MTAYALARLLPTEQHPDVIAYIERVQATFAPYGGRFLVHGAQVEVVEGDWEGDVVLVAFPDLDAARAWYASDAYQEILPLRTRHIPGDLIFLPGVPEDYDASKFAAKLRASLPA
ncbi:DUF1330 domain-containing protein [Streptomyces sp. 3MP-14]|uniref:DUF1330 domain-containing protein n=1 Tax=Streptomyces mimosae TaxID=2586635 RepID=A0A5N6A8U1_9ACTN|nr:MULTISPECIES: DUF1330 domain-containing protein [Streptomyces]KAB8165234.1 DUF1330 domain-containing protein [Streptomyces mimosae]KAB8175866.1 DUF1330 domain-containing protein [Streptomyces sp. 3MP-14]